MIKKLNRRQEVKTMSKSNKNKLGKTCPKCNNIGYLKDKSGTVHTCYDCLKQGRLM